MSQQLITRYLNELSDLRRVSGEVRESVVREAFKTLLKDWGRLQNLVFVPEYRVDTTDLQLNFHPAAIRASAGFTPWGADGATCDRLSWSGLRSRSDVAERLAA
jgi:hypothetical protein